MIQIQCSCGAEFRSTRPQAISDAVSMLSMHHCNGNPGSQFTDPPPAPTRR